MTYYEKHKDECLAYAAMVRASYTEDDIKKRKEYYDNYWEQNKISICAKQRIRRRLKKAEKEKEAQGEMPQPQEQQKPPADSKPKKIRYIKKKKVSKLPKSYIKAEPEPEPFGFATLNSTQKGVFKAIAPQGWYERPSSENPFAIEWN
jgi:hypothetical protein